jgi:cytochrome c-type biogenesis protein
VRTFTTLFILIVCVLVGSGIYFFFHQTGTPPLPNSTADTTPPSIQSVIPSTTEIGATITWKTDEPATSQIKYGKTETYDQTTPIDKNLTINHNVTLTKLDSGTTYNFTIMSKDAAGNEAASASNQTFKTLTPIPVGPKVDNLAPPFTLKDLNNNEVKLSDFRGKIVVVNFWATWCGPCMEELPFFQAISDNETAGGFKILAINDKETKDKVRSELTGKGYTFTFTILLDSTGEVNTLYDVSRWPKTFFIDADGIIRKVQEDSFKSPTEIANILNSLK